MSCAVSSVIQYLDPPSRHRWHRPVCSSITTPARWKAARPIRGREPGSGLPSRHFRGTEAARRNIGRTTRTKRSRHPAQAPTNMPATRSGRIPPCLPKQLRRSAPTPRAHPQGDHEQPPSALRVHRVPELRQGKRARFRGAASRRRRRAFRVRGDRRSDRSLLRNSSFGHCAVIIGYDGDRFTLVNSWGNGWGTTANSPCRPPTLRTMASPVTSG